MNSTTSPFRILIANGVNLDLLGQRQPEIYGTTTLASIEERLREYNRRLPGLFALPPCELNFFQSNSEEAFLATLSQGWDGAIINPGAWTHTSLALGDRLAALQLLFIEVHLSNLARREPFRHHSYSAPHAVGVIHGLGADSYLAGFTALLAKLASPV